MVLVIDVGNTNITFGVYDKKELVTTFRATTKIPRTSDEIGVMVVDMLHKNNVRTTDIQGSIIASVVPDVMHALLNALKRYCNTEPMIVGPGIKTGIRIASENPKETGADRIVDAVAAYENYGGPVLVIDYGTATTYDLIDEKGTFGVCIIAPGVGISAKALWEDTAKLPRIEIQKPESILASNTVTSMQAGLFYGQLGQTEYIINQVKKESGYEDLKVVATGGLGRLISESTDLIHIYDSKLTLEGLRILYEKNMNRK